MTSAEALQLLNQLRAGKISHAKVLRAFQAQPVADLGFAQVDTHRALRKGFPEVIFGEGKTPQQIVRIAQEMVKRGQPVLVTRVDSAHARAVKRKFSKAVHH